MKIDLMSEIQVGTPAAGSTKPAERPAPSAVGGSVPASKSPSGNGVTVTLSPQTQTMAAAPSDVVDTGKVETMKAAISNGSFKVNAETIADKLLSNAREMLGTARR
jgi:negative regulator of flagellin synthesis FlgM